MSGGACLKGVWTVFVLALWVRGHLGDVFSITVSQSVPEQLECGAAYHHASRGVRSVPVRILGGGCDDDELWRQRRDKAILLIFAQDAPRDVVRKRSESVRVFKNT